MKSLICIFGLLPALVASQGPEAVIKIRGTVVAIEAMQFQMNDAIQMQVLVRLSGGQSSIGEIVRIQYSIPVSAYEKWLKDLQLLEVFSVRADLPREFILNEFMIFVEPRAGGENIASQIKAWKPINSFNLKSLPFGKPIKSYKSTEWALPII
jgi:hypothetical protein